MSFLGRFRSLDIYRDIPRDLAEQSLSGAIVSVAALVFLSILFLSELAYLVHPVLREELVVEQPRPLVDSQGTGEGYFHHIDERFLVPLHLNITFHAIPCMAIGIEVQDLFGSLGYEGVKGLLRYRTDSNGQIKAQHGPMFFGQAQSHDNPQTFLGEGCTVIGQANIEHVPGNIHFLPAINFNQLNYFYPQGFINTSHYVNYLFFGDLTRRDIKHEKLNIAHDPLGKHLRIARDDETGERHAAHLANLGNTGNHGGQSPSRHHFSSTFEYRLSVVRHDYYKSRNDVRHTFAFTVHANELVLPRQLPAVFFRYDFHSVTVKLRYVRPSFAHFCTQLCAMLGGVFTVMKIFYRSFQTSSKAVKGIGGGRSTAVKMSEMKSSLPSDTVVVKQPSMVSPQSQPQPLAHTQPMMSPLNHSSMMHRAQPHQQQQYNQSLSPQYANIGQPMMSPHAPNPSQPLSSPVMMQQPAFNWDQAAAYSQQQSQPQQQHYQPQHVPPFSPSAHTQYSPVNHAPSPIANGFDRLAAAMPSIMRPTKTAHKD